jgi:spore maturation protein CgeB
MLDTDDKQCPVCDYERINFFCEKENSQYARCERCQHAFLTGTADVKAYEEFYQTRTSHHASDKKLDWDYSDQKLRYVYAPLLSALSKYSPIGKLVDVGCSNGAFVRAATKTGWDAVGVELEKASAETAIRNGVNVVNDDLVNVGFSENSINCVTMWQLIEHIGDPTYLLQEITRILRPGGILTVSTPNIRSIAWTLLGARWRAVDPGVHLHLFSVNSLRLLFEKHGFEVEWIATKDIKPTTIRDLMRSKGGNATHATQQKGSVAEFAMSTGGFKLAMSFACLRVINAPLNWFGIGEDIYMVLRKPSQARL